MIGMFIETSASILALDRIFMRLVPFLLVVRGCLLVITYTPMRPIGLRDLVHVR